MTPSSSSSSSTSTRQQRRQTGLEQFFMKQTSNKNSDNKDNDDDDDDDDDDEGMDICLSDLVASSNDATTNVAKTTTTTTITTTTTSTAQVFKRQKRSKTVMKLKSRHAGDDNGNDNDESERWSKENSNSISSSSSSSSSRKDGAATTTTAAMGKVGIPSPTDSVSSSTASTSTNTTTAAAAAANSTPSIRQASVPSIRRIFSHSAMEFIPSISSSSLSSKSWYDRLLERTTIPGRRPWPATCLHPLGKNQGYDGNNNNNKSSTSEERRKTSSCESKKSSKKSTPWQCPPWVELNLPRFHVLQMAWDPMGVLLAMALTNRTVVIYDWDIVKAAHLKGKTDHQRRHCNNNTHSKDVPSLYSIPPIMEFIVEYPIHCLEWNPYGQDQLAVGFQHSSHCHLYHLEKVLLWQETRQQQQRHQQQSAVTETSTRLGHLPEDEMLVSGGRNVVCPSYTYTLLQPPTTTTTTTTSGTLAGRTNQRTVTTGTSVQSILFVQDTQSMMTHVVVTNKHAIYGWKLLLHKDDHHHHHQPCITPLFQWKYQPPAPCTCATKLVATTSSMSYSSNDLHHQEQTQQEQQQPNQHQDQSSTLPQWIIVATQGGHICLLDPTRTTKERAAFVVQDKPVVIHQGKLCQDKIVHVHVTKALGLSWQQSPSSISSIMGQFQLTWVTSSGWVLRRSFEILRRHRSNLPSLALNNRMNTTTKMRRPGLLGVASSSCSSRKSKTRTSIQEPTQDSKIIIISTPGSSSVVYAPPKIRYTSNQDGETTTVVSKEYSVPSDPTCAHSCGDWTIWQETPITYRRLGHGDKYMMGHSTQVERSTERAIRLTRHDEETMRLSMDDFTNHNDRHNIMLPQAMALHPTLEWLILARGINVTILNHRA